MRRGERTIKNRPPMRKWVIALLIFYFLCIMRIYGTPKNFDTIEFVQYILFLFKETILKTINSDLKFAYFSIVVLGIILIVCIVNKEFRHIIFGRLIEVKKEITGEIKSEEWADTRKLVRKQIYVCQKLNKYKEMIVDLCEKANIYEVNFTMDDSEKYIVASFEKNGQPPVINIKNELINRLETIEPNNFGEKVLKFIISHELIHVKYHDDINKIWIWRFWGGLWIGGLAFLWNYFILSMGIRHKIIFTILLLGWVFLISVLISQSYWWQVIEFRADRLGMKLSEESDLVFEVYTKYFPDGVFEKKSFSERLKNYKKILIAFFFSKTTQVDEIAHPSNQKRKKELKSGRRWNIFEYIRYGYQIQRNFLLGRGKRL